MPGLSMSISIKRKTEKYVKGLILLVCMQVRTTLAAGQRDSGFKLPEAYTPDPASPRL